MRSPLIAYLTAALCWLLAAPALASSQGTPPQLTSLPQVMQAAATRPQVQAAMQRAAAADAGSTATWRGTWLPSLQVDALAAHVDSVSTVETPQGNLQLGDEDIFEATVALQQPLLNISMQRYGTRAAQATAVAARLQAARLARESAAAAGTRYLDWLIVQAQRDANTAQSTSLQRRVERVRNLAQGGRALDADVLDIELALAQTAQADARLQAQQHVIREDLRRLTGALVTPTGSPNIGSVGATETGETHAAVLPMLSAETAARRRADLQALRAQVSAQEARVGQSKAGALPTLGASVSHIRSSGSPITPDEDTRVGISLAWTPFTSGRRRAESQSAAAQRFALEAELREAEAGVAVQLQQARSAFDTAQSLTTLADSALAAARSTLSTRSARFDAGRATIDDVLDAEARLAEQTALAQTARYQQAQAVLAFRLAAGLPLSAPAAD